MSEAGLIAVHQGHWGISAIIEPTAQTEPTALVFSINGVCVFCEGSIRSPNLRICREVDMRTAILE